FVRADVTYLRQDFSVLQSVENESKWPKQQRYDYVVRVRPPTLDEQAEFEIRQKTAEPSAQQRAVRYALHELQSGSSAERWLILGRSTWEAERAARPSAHYQSLNSGPRPAAADRSARTR